MLPVLVQVRKLGGTCESPVGGNACVRELVIVMHATALQCIALLVSDLFYCRVSELARVKCLATAVTGCATG